MSFGNPALNQHEPSVLIYLNVEVLLFVPEFCHYKHIMFWAMNFRGGLLKFNM